MKEPATRLTLLDRLNLDFLLCRYLSRLSVMHIESAVVAFFAFPTDDFETVLPLHAAFPRVSGIVSLHGVDCLQ